MHPSKIFENNLIDNPEVCNYCFRKKAEMENVPSNLPDFVAPRLWSTEDSEKVYPPDGKSEDFLVELNHHYEAPNSGFGGAYEAKWYSGSGSGSGRKEPIDASLSQPALSCTCGWIDDEVTGEYPFDNRIPEKILEVGRRVYHRLDEQDIDVDYDKLMNSLEMRKTSDKYEYGDFEVLKDSVSDAVSVRPEV